MELTSSLQSNISAGIYLMDKAKVWCLNIEEMYNKTEVHSINILKGDAKDVGIFSDNSQTTVFEFLEAAELAYL